MMTYSQRKAQMVLHQIKARQIAKQQGVDESTVSQVLKGTGRSKRIEAAIAKACGKSRLEMFPPNTRESCDDDEDLHCLSAA